MFDFLEHTKKIVAFIVVSILVLNCFVCTYCEESQNTGEDANSSSNISIQAEAGILMEASTGTVIFEKDADKQMPPASITKIMTLILVFEAIENKKIALEDSVTVSEYAASMGGSQVFLEPMEQQTVDTMIKCIAVASANDACVAMAELVAGSEEAFVKKMNEKAKQLGMMNTNFVNCCGLDVDGHITTARDIAIMSRELITKHPEIYKYTAIWMENIVHSTKKGEKEFGLTNTNKLIKQYPYATGLKTGSTSKAKYCVSATARKNDVDLIAVVMAAPDYKVRFKDAAAMLDYGFANCSVYKDNNMPKLKSIKVKNSMDKSLKVKYSEPFSFVSLKEGEENKIDKKLKISNVKAPVKKGEKVGELVYYMNGNTIGSVDVIACDECEESDFKSYISLFIEEMLN